LLLPFDFVPLLVVSSGSTELPGEQASTTTKGDAQTSANAMKGFVDIRPPPEARAT